VSLVLLLCGVVAGLSPALAAPEATATSVPLVPRAAAPEIRSVAGFEPAAGGFEAALRGRLLREGRRQGIDRAPAPSQPFGIDDRLDDLAAAERGRRASRTILRSLRGALDDHLETAARGSGSFSALFRLLDARDATAPAPAGGGSAVAAPTAAAPREGVDFGFRFRLDAHPRLILGGRVGRLEGRIEMPVLDREIRMAVEHPIGGYGGAALRGGHSAERGSWADLSLSLRF
jgi:hypothetical protein